MVGLLKRLFRRRRPPSTYHKALAIHIAATTRGAGRKLWP